MPQTAIAANHPAVSALSAVTRLRLCEVHRRDDFAGEFAPAPVFLLRKHETRVAKRVLRDTVIEAEFVGFGLRFGAHLFVVVLKHARIMRTDRVLSMRDQWLALAHETSTLLPRLLLRDCMRKGRRYMCLCRRVPSVRDAAFVFRESSGRTFRAMV